MNIKQIKIVGICMAKLLYIPTAEIVFPFGGGCDEETINKVIFNLCVDDPNLDWYKSEHNMPIDCVLVREEFEIIYD